ncbi:M20 metallopeptidase family protein [Paenibacillus sp. 1P07SE]|uniref:M20 metallopeptidase family protein n=1 Tax=Paenibacillus sp. 1P07SE TaxID=3132209 RepID=UPI0039A6D9D0
MTLPLPSLVAELIDLYPELVTLRRHFHMHPELSFEEVETPRFIASYHRKLGLDVRTGVGGRGVVAVLEGAEPGRTIAFRADFDGLPIEDAKTVAYRSTVKGVMHACGHDLHTAALLGTAKVLSRHRDKLHGTVVFIHQFAEEVIPGGALPMIKDGCLEGVDFIYAAHVGSQYPAGTVAVGEGYRTAAGDTFAIDIMGKGGHGAMPQLTVDPLIIGSQLLLQLQLIVSRQIDPLQSAVVTVGSFQGGNAYNIIPDTARLTGTVRTFDPAIRDQVEQTIGRMTAAACDCAGAEHRYQYTRGYPALWNRPEESARVSQLAEALIGADNVIHDAPSMGMEDFAYYLEQCPGAFFWAGGRNPDIDAVFPHHHPRFDVDERAILTIAQLFLSLVSDHERP